MSRRVPSAVAAVLAAVAVGAKVATLIIAPGGGSDGAGAATSSLGPFLDVALFSAVQLFYLGLTCLLIARRPRHRITWLMATIVLLAVLGGLSEAVTEQPAGVPEPWWWNVAAWFRTWYFVGFISAYVLLFHLFPTGRPIRGRLVWATRIAVFAATVTTAVGMLGKADAVDAPNPAEVSPPSWVQVPISGLLAVSWVITLATIIPILIVRFRRSAGEERQQLKWFLFCVTAALGLFWMQPLADWLFLVAIALPGIGIGVALLRYRLYDIDRIISRTSSYAIVTGVLIATYIAVVASLTSVFGTQSDFAVAVATLTAAALARPFLRRVQNVVDRRFNRARYDALRTVDAFGSRLRDQVDPHHVSEDFTAIVRTTLQPDHVTIWIRQPS